MSERPDRPVSMLMEVEQQQLKIVREFVPQPIMVDNEALQRAQFSRETTALRFLAVADMDETINPAMHNPLAKINSFAQKTKTNLLDSFSYNEASGQWRCVLQYRSIVQEQTGIGFGPQKGVAKANACQELINAFLAASRKRPLTP